MKGSQQLRQRGRMVRWHTNVRAAHPYTRLYMWAMQLRRGDQAFRGEAHTLLTARRLQARANHPPTALTRALTAVSVLESASMQTWLLDPRRAKPTSQVLYVHGGGYVHPLTADYWRLARALVTAPAQVRVPEYPLAPDATLDEVLPRLLDVYTEMTRARPDLPVVIMGDSAGGALVLAMAIRLRELGQAQPASVVMLSPWLDARLQDSEVGAPEASDPLLDESGLRAAGRWWAGNVSLTILASVRSTPAWLTFRRWRCGSGTGTSCVRPSTPWPSTPIAIAPRCRSMSTRRCSTSGCHARSRRGAVPAMSSLSSFAGARMPPGTSRGAILRATDPLG